MEDELCYLIRMVEEHTSEPILAGKVAAALRELEKRQQSLDQQLSAVMRQNNELIEAEQTRRELDRGIWEKLHQLDERTSGLVVIGGAQ